MIIPPRAISPEGGEPLPVVDLVAPYLGRPGVIALVGPRGSGKRTALRSLVDALGVTVLEQPKARTLRDLGRDRLVVYGATGPLRTEHLLVLRLAPWGQDEIVEYLLAAHREQCGSVMTRLSGARDRDRPGGNAALWRAVLDAMAVDDRVTDVATVFLRLDTEEWSRHRPVRVVHEAHRVLRTLGKTLERPLNPDVVAEAAHHLRADPYKRERIRRLAVGRTQSMAVSLLHAADDVWLPSANAKLTRALLRGVVWAHADLSGATLDRADLSWADLREANLDRARLRDARLRKACLHGALLREATAAGADLSGADLSHARAERAVLRAAGLRHARLDGALLTDAQLQRACLEGASLVRADLAGAVLAGAEIAGADFSRARLEKAILANLPLREARFDGAVFADAVLAGCDLSHMRLPAVSFARADLRGALLTGAHLADGSFRGADLRGVRAADVVWERADLSGADLTGATFHMGSSRSGRVGSVVPMEGSRTGFYTDDYEEQHFKAPEEIRKANLRGADLRGARIDGVDFYLVDVREAKYSPEQERHLRSCGAILEART